MTRSSSKLIFLAIFLLIGSPCTAQQSGIKPAASSAAKQNDAGRTGGDSPGALPWVPLPRGPRLRELAPIDGTSPILIGGTTNYPHLGTSAETILNREFQWVTPGNAFKQSGIHPEPGVWNWTKADQWIEHCAARDQIMRLHAPISPQCSAWAENDLRTGPELLQNLEEYVTAICQRYNGKPHVRWIDVVNETVSRDGTWFGPREGTGRWENPWPRIGYDESVPLRPPLYIKRAFELASIHAPDMKLIYNQHAGMEQEMWDKVRATILYLREQGLRVDGVGWQAHVDAGFEKDPQNMKRLNELITWAHANDLGFHVTENTVWLYTGDEAEYAAQAETFGTIVRTLIEHAKTGVVTWNAWQMRESDTQRSEKKGTLFTAEGIPNPAYYAVQRELIRMKKP